MIPGDEILYQCNESELLHLARTQGLPALRSGIPHEELVAIVLGIAEVKKEHLAWTNFTREKLETFLAENWERLRSQLPGCDGKCRSFPCSEVKHLNCFIPVEGRIT